MESETVLRPEWPSHSARSNYREFPAPAYLSQHFLCLWTQVIRGSGTYKHRVLPDGCVDIVFIDNQPPIVEGPWTCAFTATFAAGTRVLGARLRPGYATGVLGLPAAELLNRSIPLTLLRRWNWTDAFAWVSEKQDFTTRMRSLSEALASSLASVAPPNENVLNGMHWLARHPEGRVEELCRWLGISERLLHRRFSVAIGYGPKMFQSVLRFQRLLRLADAKMQVRTLADAATSVGYADQSHMTREVRRFAGTPPSTLILHSAKCTLGFSDLLHLA